MDWPGCSQLDGLLVDHSIHRPPHFDDLPETYDLPKAGGSVASQLMNIIEEKDSRHKIDLGNDHVINVERESRPSFLGLVEHLL